MTGTPPLPEQIRIVIPSRLDFLGILNHAINELGEYLQLEEEMVDALAIAIIEAGTNAIQHGSPEPGTSNVDFEFQITPDLIEVDVHDQGPGFDLSRVTVTEPGPDNLLKSRGRGIFLMRSFMDEVEFEFGRNGGTTVRLRKHRSPGKDEAGT